MGTIYKITNKTNNKIYIGQTINTIEHRLSKHINDAFREKGCPYLGKAIRKYGASNFTIEPLNNDVPNDMLDSMEQYWISYYNSNDPSIGYNMTRGGKLTSVAISEEDENLIHLLWNSGKSIGQITNETSHTAHTVDRVLANNDSYSTREAMIRSNKKAKKVKQYDLLGVFINEYNRLYEAAESVNGNYQSIGQACINKCVAYGYQWRYSDDDPPGKINYNEHKHMQRPIIQLDLDGNIVYQRFESAHEAAQYCGKNNSSSILACCRGKRKTAYGFKWKFCDIDFFPEKTNAIPESKL